MLGNTLEATHEARIFYGKRSSTDFASKKPLLGSEDALRLSYSYATPHSLSLFIAGEKDYGELGGGERTEDLMPIACMPQLEHRALTLVLGDYRVARGSGLILSQGAFPLSFLSLTPRQGTGVRPVRSMTESDFSRGAAGMLSLGELPLGALRLCRRTHGRRFAHVQQPPLVQRRAGRCRLRFRGYPHRALALALRATAIGHSPAKVRRCFATETLHSSHESAPSPAHRVTQRHRSHSTLAVLIRLWPREFCIKRAEKQ